MTNPHTTRALRALRDQRATTIPPQQLVTLIQQRLVTLDEHGALTLTKRGRHALHTADTHAKKTQRIPHLARALSHATHELRDPIRALHGDRSEHTIRQHADTLATLASAARHLWNRDERTLLKHLSQNPQALTHAAKNLGWVGRRAHNTLHRILQHTTAALEHTTQ